MAAQRGKTTARRRSVRPTTPVFQRSGRPILLTAANTRRGRGPTSMAFRRLALLAAAAASAAVTGLATTPRAPTLMRVAVGPALAGLPPVAPNFVGFSLEIYNVELMIGRAGEPPRQSYAQLLRNLHSLSAGPHPGPTLRIGGNSAEDTCFVAAGHGPPNSVHCVQNVTAADLDAYRRFAEIAPNISYVIDTNLMQGSPAVGAAHIAALGAAGLWPHIQAVELGNECDHWPAAVQMKFAEYESRFAAFAEAYRAAGMPPAMIQGATFCCLNPAYLLGLRSYAKRFSSSLKTISYHRYAASHCGSPNLTAGTLLERSASSGQAAIMAGIAKEIAPIPLWGGEVNSCSCGGCPNVSDTFASTLWVVDFLSELSKGGVQGVNFHGGPLDIYSPVKYSPAAGTLSFVSPLYVGLLAWSELVANSSRWMSADVTASVPMKNSWAHATLSTSVSEGPAGSCTVLRVLVIAKDLPSSTDIGDDIEVTVSVPPSALKKPQPHAALLRLTAPMLSSRSDIDWAGQSFGNKDWNSTDGRPMGQRVAEKVVAHAGGGTEYAFTLPPLSAAMLVVKDCSSGAV